MDVDAKIQQYLLLAKGQRGRAVAELINKATAEPGLFAFGELLDLPNVKELLGTDLEPSFRLLELFAHGSWSDYKASSSSLPAINPSQQLKLKQLSVISFATKLKVLPYDQLMTDLDIPTVRELEDFLITECFYNNIIKGKLDQRNHSLQIHTAIGRDVKREEVGGLAEGLRNWTVGCDQILAAIEQQIQTAIESAEASRKQKEDLESKQDEVRRNLKHAELDLPQDNMLVDDTMGFEYMEEDRATVRPKSRRR